MTARFTQSDAGSLCHDPSMDSTEAAAPTVNDAPEQEQELSDLIQAFNDDLLFTLSLGSKELLSTPTCWAGSRNITLPSATQC